MLQLMFFSPNVSHCGFAKFTDHVYGLQIFPPNFSLFACSFSGSDHFLVCLGGGIVSLYFTELTLFMTSDNTSL